MLDNRITGIVSKAFWVFLVVSIPLQFCFKKLEPLETLKNVFTGIFLLAFAALTCLKVHLETDGRGMNREEKDMAEKLGL